MNAEETRFHLLSLSPETDLEEIAQIRYQSHGKKMAIDLSFINSEAELTEYYLRSKNKLNQVKEEFWQHSHHQLIDQLKQNGLSSLPYYKSVCDRLVTISASRSMIQDWGDASEPEHDYQLLFLYYCYYRFINTVPIYSD